MLDRSSAVAFAICGITFSRIKNLMSKNLPKISDEFTVVIDMTPSNDPPPPHTHTHTHTHTNTHTHTHIHTQKQPVLGLN